MIEFDNVGTEGADRKVSALHRLIGAASAFRETIRAAAFAPPPAIVADRCKAASDDLTSAILEAEAAAANNEQEFA